MRAIDGRTKGAVRIATLALAASAVVACDVPIGNPPRDVKGEPVVESTSAGQQQVIVRLRFEPPEGAAPDSEPYQSALRATRDRFLVEIDELPHRVVRTYDTLPLVVLSVAPADRATIEKLPSVAGVEDDRLNAPLAH
jgi:hypothetical protein